MTVPLAHAAPSIPLPRSRQRLPAATSARESRNRGVGYASDALMLIALAFLVPFGILIVGAPLALGLRALLWLFGWV